MKPRGPASNFPAGWARRRWLVTTDPLARALLALWHRGLQARFARIRSVLSFAARRAEQANLTQVAASLTFSTVLALVPLLAVALALFTVFPQFAEFRGALERHLLRDLLPAQFSGTILRYLDDFASKATRVGAAGLAVLALTALTTVLTVDHALNDVWRVRARRSLFKRLLVYGTLIALGPILAGASLTLTSMVATVSAGWLHQAPGPARSALSAAPLLFSCIAFTMLYVVIPNRRVDWRDAATGGVVAGVLAEILSRGFAFYVSRGSVLTVYGAFAVVPVFLLWVYFSWLTVLFGAAIAATVSGLRTTRFDDELRAGNRLVSALGLLKLLLEARSGPGSPERTTSELALKIRGDEEETNHLLQQLQELGYVRYRRVARSVRSRRWSLLVDPDKADLAPLFHHLGIDPHNSLLSSREGLGLDAWLRPVLQAQWLRRPLSRIAADCGGDAPG
jgi:membrane protein